MSSLRLFIAIETPPEITPQITAIRDRLRTSNANVRWEPDEKLHATLKFLGDADERLLPDFVYYIRRVCQTNTHLLLKYKGIGCFPNMQAPRVIWVGMEDLKGNLSSLRHEIESAFVPLGFEPEERKFHSHVTLGRVKGDRDVNSLLRMMESTTFESQPVTIQEIALINSELRSAGSVYTTLEKFPLQG